jgi:Flp pilus assembly protein TadD
VAREAFEARYRLAQQLPDDPAAWYALGLAYNDLGDRRHARAAMREAVRVWRSGDAERS